MNKKFHGGVIFCLVTIFTVMIGSGMDQAKWRGTIEEVAGVTVIKNPKEPIFNENIFELKEELVIKGADADLEEEMFQDITAIAVDKEQNIYALDGKAANVKVFDKTGSFLKSIGRRGEGPGEFGRPENILISPHQEIVIEDTGRRLIHFLDLNGEYLRQWPLNWVFSSGPKFTSQGEVFVSYALMGKQIEVVLNKLDSNLDPLLTLTKIPMERPPKVHLFLYRFVLDLRWDITSADEIIWGVMTSPEYELFIHDTDGKLIKRITKEYDPIEITNAEYEKLIDLWFGDPLGQQWDIIIPKNYPPFHTFLLDDEGRVYVRRFEKAEKGERHFIEIFDPQGRYLTNVILPANMLPCVIQKGQLYTIEETDEGFEVIKRYRVIWKY